MKRIKRKRPIRHVHINAYQPTSTVSLRTADCFFVFRGIKIFAAFFVIPARDCDDSWVLISILSKQNSKNTAPLTTLCNCSRKT